MKIVVSLHNGVYFAETVEDNGDVFELTRNADKDALLQEIKNMGITAPVEFEGN